MQVRHARLRYGWLALTTLAAYPVHAQETLEPPPVPIEVPPPPSERPASAAAERSVYLPEDFARFAPRNALEMLEQVPGFTIGAEEKNWGLGQASAHVLVKGRRLSSKSNGVRDQLNRIAAGDVVRIEIVDGAPLDVPGLSGRVANIIAESSDISGQVAWEPQLAMDYATTRWLQGEVSVSGTEGPVG